MVERVREASRQERQAAGPARSRRQGRRDFHADRANELWLTDISEHPTAEGKLYLCAVKDVFSNRIVGYSISDRMKSRLAVDALTSAVVRRSVEGADTTGCVVHSDRGSQGGFNWSSQHLDAGGVCLATADWTKKTSDAPESLRRQWRADRALRPAMRSPGRPDPSRVVQRQFWRLIATGISSAEAAIAVGVSVPVGMRWFRHAGGMAPISLAEPAGRYLSFEEREEIALLRAQGRGVREIARAISRDPATVSRELRCNAATRGGKPESSAGPETCGGRRRCPPKREPCGFADHPHRGKRCGERSSASHTSTWSVPQRRATYRTQAAMSDDARAT